MAFLWSISNIYLVNIEIPFHFGCCAIHPHEIVTTGKIFFIISNLIGDHIFLQSKPQNSIACHQTLVQSLGTRQYVLPMHIFEFTQMLAELGINAHIVYCTTMAILKFFVNQLFNFVVANKLICLSGLLKGTKQ